MLLMKNKRRIKSAGVMKIIEFIYHQNRINLIVKNKTKDTKNEEILEINVITIGFIVI